MKERSGSWLHSLSQSTSEVQLAWEEGCLPSSPLPPPQVDGNVATSYNLLWGTLFSCGGWNLVPGCLWRTQTPTEKNDVIPLLPRLSCGSFLDLGALIH